MQTPDAGDAYFRARGGGGNIGAKMLEIVFPREKITAIFDCGIGMLPRTNKDNIYLPDLAGLNPDYENLVFLTHSHLDHIGAIPKLKAMYPKIKIFATEPTQKITQVMGKDSIHIRKGSGLLPHFTEEELAECTDGMATVKTADWFELGKGFMARFEPAGHIRGAATILLKTPYGIFADSGDISFANTTTVLGASKRLEDKVRWLSLESTNGDISLPEPEIVMAELIQDVIRVIRKGGNVLIPAFAQGRGPDVAIRLGRELRELKIPIWSGGLLRGVTEACSRSQWLSDIKYSGEYYKNSQGENTFSLEPENIQWVNMMNCVKISSRNKRVGNVVVIPNGMLEAGYSQFFFSVWAGEEKNAILLPGYQAEETYGRALISIKRGDLLSLTSPITGKSADITVRAEVKQYKLSGHADGKQLAGWVGNMGTHSSQKLDKVILVHGDESGQIGLRNRLNALPNCPTEITVGTNGKVITL